MPGNQRTMVDSKTFETMPRLTRCLQQGRKKHQRCDRKELFRLNILITFLISIMLLYPIVTDGYHYENYS